MTGDPKDMARRLATILPAGWFGDDTPMLNAVLEGLGTGYAQFWTLLQAVIAQSRIGTASGSFLDLIAADYFGPPFTREAAEADDAFRTRILEGLLRPRATRAAVSLALTELTGRAPAIFEPALTSDTGGYTTGGIGYCVGGGWGNLSLPYQVFMTLYRPSGGGIAELAGYGGGGVPVYGSLAMETDEVSDATLQAAVPPLLPAGTTAWIRISN
jgi:hypothetical protein